MQDLLILAYAPGGTMPRKTRDKPLAALLPSWKFSLEAAGKSPKTTVSYLSSARLLVGYLEREGQPSGVNQIGAPAIRAFLMAETARTSAVSSQLHYRNLRVLFGWLEREEERTEPNPMAKVDKPKAPVAVKPFFTDADLAALLKVTGGRDFESRRDHAILRIFIDCGVRVSGLAGLRFSTDDEDENDVFLSQRRLRVVLKGGDQTWVPIGRKAAYAIDRYLRERQAHPQVHSPWLWLGTRGRGVAHFTDSGIRAMLERRGEEAGVQHVYPHRFRHTFADNWYAAGGQPDDLMHIAGWKTYDMPLRYARGRGVERAAGAHARLSPGDRL